MSYSNPKACINAVLIEKYEVEDTFFLENCPHPTPPKQTKALLAAGRG